MHISDAVLDCSRRSLRLAPECTDERVAVLSLMAAITLAGWPSLARAAWLKHAVSPLRLALATLWFALFVAAPWVYLAPWRPQGLPATSVELMFIIAKLSVTALLMATGVALIIRQATWTTSTPSSAS